MIHITNNSIPTGQEQRIERKFFVLPQKIGFAYALLNQLCIMDSEYPAEQINSLYFDTSDLSQHVKSYEGESRKNKIRIRWYHTLDRYKENAPVFLELKSREGFTGSKKRKMMTVPTHQLETRYLYNGIVSKTELSDTLAGFDYYPEAPVYPVIAISYWRYRFTELLTGMRVALDCNIRSTMINRHYGNSRQSELKVAGAVIEIKGTKMELPVTLQQMRLLEIDWSRFSKYSLCLDSHLAEPDTGMQMWPTGIQFEI
jgi:hypothetical protein